LKPAPGLAFRGHSISRAHKPKPAARRNHTAAIFKASEKPKFFAMDEKSPSDPRGPEFSQTAKKLSFSLALKKPGLVTRGRRLNHCQGLAAVKGVQL
jgi:hypothetical protein